jgi:hypothetical protein
VLLTVPAPPLGPIASVPAPGGRAPPSRAH